MEDTSFIPYSSNRLLCDAFHYGIVLRSYLPVKASCVLFDAYDGKIKCFLGKRALPPMLSSGTLLRYQLFPKGDWFALHNYTLCKKPSAWVEEDLIFLHQVLEILMYFLAEAQAEYGSFSFLLDLYRPLPPGTDPLLYRLVFLNKLFLQFDEFPECFDGELLRKSLSLIYRSSSTIVSIEERNVCYNRLYQLFTFFIKSNPTLRNMMARSFHGVSNECSNPS